MPLDATDPRPRNPFGQFAGGTSVTPDQMNRAYGIRTRVLASLLRTRPAMQNIPPLSSKDIARVTGLAAKARGIVALEKLNLGEKPKEAEIASCTSCKAEKEPPRIWYPSFYINDRTEAGKKLAEIPRKGTATIEYRVRDITTREDENGKITSSATLEIQSIDPASGKQAPDPIAAFSAAKRRLIALARGDYAIPAMVKSKMLPYVSHEPKMYRNPTHENLAITAQRRTGPKGIQLRRDRLAKVLRAQRAAPALAGLALSALAARAVELAELPGEKIRRPQFVEEDGVVKIVKTDGTAAEIGRAPGFANRLRRNKGKLIAGGLATAAGAVLAKKLLGKGKPAA